MPDGPGIDPGMERRKASLERDLADARVELGQVKHAMNRYEKTIEAPRLLDEIKRIELELEEIEDA